MLQLFYISWTCVSSRPACLTVSSLYSTRQLGPSPVFVARSILRMLSPVFNASEHPCTSSSNWRPLSTELFTALHLSTCQTECSTSLTRRRGCARRPPVFLTSTRRGVSLSAIALLLLLAHHFGTVYLLTSSLRHHSQHFVRNWKRIYFVNHIQTSFFSCVATVVLEVTFT